MPALKYLCPHRYTRGWNQITHRWYYHGYRYCKERCINEIESQKRYTTCYISIFFFTVKPPSDCLFLKKNMVCSVKHKSEDNIYSAISLYVINELFIARFFKTNFWWRKHEGILLDDMEAWTFSRSYACVMFSKQFLHFAWSKWMFSVEIFYIKNN